MSYFKITQHIGKMYTTCKLTGDHSVVYWYIFSDSKWNPELQLIICKNIANKYSNFYNRENKLSKILKIDLSTEISNDLIFKFK